MKYFVTLYTLVFCFTLVSTAQFIPGSNSSSVAGYPGARASFLTEGEECTIGVASGRATKDGRPMIWKTRDTDSYNNAVTLITSFRIPFLAVIDAGNRQSAWMSLNARGFAILNSLAYDLTAGSSGLSNGTLMAYAAGTCVTVADFQNLLDSTNITGRRTNANFAVMDSTGAAAIFETSGSAYWKFDAADTLKHPEGYVLRTNFTMTGKGTNGLIRFNRTTALFRSFASGDSISPKSILRYQMRDFADQNGIPYPMPYAGSIGGGPYGFIPATNTICRTSTASAAVMQGVLPGEPAMKSTFWVILGCPATGIVVPYWNVGSPPPQSSDVPLAQLNDMANEIFYRLTGGSAWPSYLNSFLLRNERGWSVLPHLFAAEDLIFASAESLLARWRTGNASPETMLQAERQYADLALTAMGSALTMLQTTAIEPERGTPTVITLEQNYPNPFNPLTNVDFRLSIGGRVKISIFDLLGREVAVLVNEEKPAGTYRVTWNASGFPSGIYFYTLKASTFRETKRMVLVK